MHGATGALGLVFGALDKLGCPLQTRAGGTGPAQAGCSELPDIDYTSDHLSVT